MLKLVIAFVSTAVVFGAMDAVWLTLMGERLYKPALGDLMSGKVDGLAAVLFYVIYLSGLVYFAVWPALQSGDWRKALLNGVVLGVVAYATYDLTNQATLRNWSVRVTVADLCWGAFVSATAATIGYAITAWANRAIS